MVVGGLSAPLIFFLDSDPLPAWFIVFCCCLENRYNMNKEWKKKKKRERQIQWLHADHTGQTVCAREILKSSANPRQNRSLLRHKGPSIYYATLKMVNIWPPPTRLVKQKTIDFNISNKGCHVSSNPSPYPLRDVINGRPLMPAVDIHLTHNNTVELQE